MNNSHKQWHKQQLLWLTYNLHQWQGQHNHNNLLPEDNLAVEEADNHNNLPPEDNSAVGEAVEEAAEANMQQDNKQQDKQQLHHLVPNPSKE